MNVVKKPVEYTLGLTHSELLMLEQILYDWRIVGRPSESMKADVRVMCSVFADELERAGRKAREGVA